jgi:hypothetical protein
LLAHLSLASFPQQASLCNFELHARLISWCTKENWYDPNSFSGQNTDKIINNKSQSLTTLQKNGCQATKQTKEHVIKQTK